MKTTVKITIVAFLLSCAHVVFAYEPGTHLKLSEQAARKLYVSRQTIKE